MPSEAYMARMNAMSGDTANPEQKKSDIRERMRRERSERWSVVNAIDAAVLGAADTVTFGFMDEIGAGLDSVFLGKDYDTALAEQRAFFEVSQEQNFGSLLTGQIAGGFVPFMGFGAGRGAGAALKAGAFYGGAYGFGSDEGNFVERLDGALSGAAVGAAGGYLLSALIVPLAKTGGQKALSLMKRGKPVSIDADDIRFGDDLVDNAETTANPSPLGKTSSMAPKATDEVDDLAAATLDKLEDGALVTARELLGDPQAALQAVEKRLGKMTQEEAVGLLKRIDEAEANGTVSKDPHYRSLLRVATEEGEYTAERAAMAAEIFEEATAKLAAKAGVGRRSLKSIEQEVTKELKKGLTIADTEARYEASRRGVIDARIEQHSMFIASGRLLKLREVELPKIIAGEEGARERVTDAIAEAAYQFTLSRGVLSNAGRALGVLRHKTQSRNIDISNTLTKEEIKARIAGSIAELGDADLKALMGRMGRLDQTEEAIDILLDPKEAAAFSVWTRTKNSVSMFLRSNAMSPATGFFNVVSAVGNDLFRNHAGRSKAIKNLTKAGRLSEAQAMRFEHEAAKAVYWKAHREGIRALTKRIKWEFWTDVERVAAVGWGTGKVATKARLARETMLKSGYAPNANREFNEGARLAVTDLDGFNQRMEGLKTGGGGLANVVYHLERARAVSANTLDAAGGAAMKLFTGSIDDFGREFTRVKETYAESTRFAVREAQEMGMTFDQMQKYVPARAKDLAELPPSEILDRVEASFAANPAELSNEASFLRDLQGKINDEADAVLFNDGPQTKLGKVSAAFLEKIDPVGLVFPYVRTPIRLFEQGVVNYGPFGKFAPEIKKIIEAGGPEAELAKARVEVGTMVFNMGIAAGLAGAITATNGSFENSANLDAGPPMRLNLIGGGFIEIGRLDPISYTVGMGAIIGQALLQGWDESADYEMQEVIRGVGATVMAGTYDAILNKSYMKSLSDFMEAISGPKDGSWTGVEKVLMNGATRLVPFSGVSRQINDSFRDSAAESVGWADAMLRTIPGMGWGLAPRIDPLGDEVKPRQFGVNFGNDELTEGEQISPVKKQLRELGIDISTLRKSDPDGFDLTSDELSEVRRIRGKEALNEDGLTMEQALGSLFEDPWFQTLQRKEDKRKAVVETMAEFNKPAWEILEQRSPSYAGKKAYTKSLQDYIAMNLETRQAERLAKRDTEAMGLPIE